MVQNLILFGYSGFAMEQITRLEKLIQDLPDCAVILMQDGVLGTNSSSQKPYQNLVSKSIPVSCLVEDFIARGFEESQLMEGIQPIHYSEIIDLVAESGRVFSWL